jgi:putative transcriptional regulator
MGVSYNRLWKMLIDKNMKRIEMQYLTGISGNILARMGKNQYVSMETIEKICKKLDCTVDEMLEFTMMSNKSRHVKLLKLEECFRSRKKKLKKDNTPDTA